ncbi:unnamed protein product [Vitrella brassicaformis CCMP3155]|uniref:Metallo-beta-lactamase domain-containing protein n=2 Tax=Vitrella brassicaformis TaxID=1169539 RepID=A0A0G4ELE8_VITBC|nr:unnamed protein product [Vitrella brassicaformis CCMP3155]|eukprot:CEL97777.1 unnamed protein product [Vitrella brassicaformis CCMP3155]
MPMLLSFFLTSFPLSNVDAFRLPPSIANNAPFNARRSPSAAAAAASARPRPLVRRIAAGSSSHGRPRPQRQHSVLGYRKTDRERGSDVNVSSSTTTSAINDDRGATDIWPIIESFGGVSKPAGGTDRAAIPPAKASSASSESQSQPSSQPQSQPPSPMRTTPLKKQTDVMEPSERVGLPQPAFADELEPQERERRNQIRGKLTGAFLVGGSVAAVVSALASLDMATSVTMEGFSALASTLEATEMSEVGGLLRDAGGRVVTLWEVVRGPQFVQAVTSMLDRVLSTMAGEGTNVRRVYEEVSKALDAIVASPFRNFFEAATLQYIRNIRPVDEDRYYLSSVAPFTERPTVLEQHADNVYTLTQPLVVAGNPIDHRATVVRISPPRAQEFLVVINPPAPTKECLRQIASLPGVVKYIVVSNTGFEHTAFAADFAKEFEAEVLAPGDLHRSKVEVDRWLSDEVPPEWGSAMEVAVLDGEYFKELVFFHKPSRTLIATDLCAEKGPSKVTTEELPTPPPKSPSLFPPRPRINPFGGLCSMWFGFTEESSMGIPLMVSRVLASPRGANKRLLQRLASWSFDKVLTGHHASPISYGKVKLLERLLVLGDKKEEKDAQAKEKVNKETKEKDKAKDDERLKEPLLLDLNP